MKQAEFLNLDTKQVQWLDASLEHPNLVKVPEGAGAITEHCSGVIHIWSGSKYLTHLGDGTWIDMAEEYKNYTAETWCSGGYSTIIWKRNSLQEKINETLSVLNVSKAQLSVLLGREKSYVKRLLAKVRNVTENTKLAVIGQLEQLIRVHEYEQKAEGSKCIGELTVKLSVDTKEVQDELKKAYGLIDQANENSTSWQTKYEVQKYLSWFLFWLFASAGCAFFILLWGAV